MWARAVPLSQRFTSTGASLDAIAVAFALAGISAYALNIILAARLGFIQRLFGGLDALYRTHRVNGRIAYLLIFAHVCLIIASRATLSASAALGLFTPSAGKIILFGVVAFVTMSFAIVATLYVRLVHEVFVYVQRALGAIFVLALAHVFLTPGTKASSHVLTIYLTTLSIAAVAAFLYRSVFGNVLVERHTYLVTNVRELDPSIVEITMEPRGKPLHPIPGQFVYATFYSDEFNAQFHPVSFQSKGQSAMIVVRPGDVRDQFHPFSLTSAAKETELRLAIKAVGTFTTALHRLTPGAAALIEGPYGEFSYLNVPSTTQMWVAGGIGITPFLSMARSLEGDSYDVELVYCVKERAEAHFLHELEAIAAKLPNFKVVLVAEDEQGVPNAHLIEDLVGPLADRAIMLCGPPAMVTALTQQFQRAGIERHRIFSERFGFGPRR
ncbi:MAG: hypothetical protein QOF16_1130 [Actinomycetota bacterium]|nr:hypothetical protein [Actinomycetota bacterium]MEA2487476.1 hypothetical protein [Actinomycetota bacterium]